MRLRRDKAAYAVGRPSWGSSFLGDPGAKFLCGKLERGTKKEKSSKKERKEGLWKLTLLMEIRKERGFPQQLEKSLAKDARLFHSSHRPNNKDLSILYCRQRSTLIKLNFGPKDGEHLRDQASSQQSVVKITGVMQLILSRRLRGSNKRFARTDRR